MLLPARIALRVLTFAHTAGAAVFRNLAMSFGYWGAVLAVCVAIASAVAFVTLLVCRPASPFAAAGLGWSRRGRGNHEHIWARGDMFLLDDRVGPEHCNHCAGFVRDGVICLVCGRCAHVEHVRYVQAQFCKHIASHPSSTGSSKQNQHHHQHQQHNISSTNATTTRDPLLHDHTRRPILLDLPQRPVSVAGVSPASAELSRTFSVPRASAIAHAATTGSSLNTNDDSTRGRDDETTNSTASRRKLLYLSPGTAARSDPNVAGVGGIPQVPTNTRDQLSTSSTTQQPSLLVTPHPYAADFGRRHEHQLAKGNLKLTACCAVCGLPAGSRPTLEDYRCLWCDIAVHTECEHKLPWQCSLGKHSDIIVPPEYVLRISSRRVPSRKHTPRFKVTVPPHMRPLICVVNPGAGSQNSPALLRFLYRYLNPIQVVDVSRENPEAVLRAFESCLPQCSILVCGGDGTVQWVLSILEKIIPNPDNRIRSQEPDSSSSSSSSGNSPAYDDTLQQQQRAKSASESTQLPRSTSANNSKTNNNNNGNHEREDLPRKSRSRPRPSWPPVAILPLGTGNDLARVLGWGGGWNGEDLEKFFAELKLAEPVPLDRWKITIETTNVETLSEIANCKMQDALDESFKNKAALEQLFSSKIEEQEKKKQHQRQQEQQQQQQQQHRSGETRGNVENDDEQLRMMAIKSHDSKLSNNCGIETPGSETGESDDGISESELLAMEATARLKHETLPYDDDNHDATIVGNHDTQNKQVTQGKECTDSAVLIAAANSNGSTDPHVTQARSRNNNNNNSGGSSRNSNSNNNNGKHGKHQAQSTTVSTTTTTTTSKRKTLKDALSFSALVRSPNKSNAATVSSSPTKNPSRKIVKEVTMNNYFSVGFDASVAFDFHTARKQNPKYFKNRFLNKVMYTLFGAKHQFTSLFYSIWTWIREWFPLSQTLFAFDLRDGVSNFASFQLMNDRTDIHANHPSHIVSKLTDETDTNTVAAVKAASAAAAAAAATSNAAAAAAAETGASSSSKPGKSDEGRAHGAFLSPLDLDGLLRVSSTSKPSTPPLSPFSPLMSSTLFLENSRKQISEFGGVIVLNIPSYGGGARIYAAAESEGYPKCLYDDQNLQVVGVANPLHLGASVVGLSSPVVIGTAGEVSFHIEGKNVGMQVDGEPWLQEGPCIVTISYYGQAIMLRKRPATQRRSWNFGVRAFHSRSINATHDSAEAAAAAAATVAALSTSANTLSGPHDSLHIAPHHDHRASF